MEGMTRDEVEAWIQHDEELCACEHPRYMHGDGGNHACIVCMNNPARSECLQFASSSR